LSSAVSETHSSAGGFFLSADSQPAISQRTFSGGKENKNEVLIQ